MSNQQKKGLVPERRFPEFRDAGEWEQLPIGKKVDLLSGYPFKSSEISEDSTGIPLMRGINITEGIIRHSKDMDRYFLGNAEALKKYRLRTNDLVIGMDGSKVGKNSALVTNDDAGSLLIQRVARLRTDCKATISFIFQHIHSNRFHSYVDRINTSGGIPHISANQINEFEICFPPIEEEQQKIADCLTSIDELITAQTQKLDALKAHKKGLMQQLFPAEGQTVPKLRFPEFQGAGEWEEKPLGKVATFSKGKGVSKSDISPNGKQPCIRYGKLYTYYNEKIETVESYTDVPADELVLSEENDVIIPASGETEEDIATASCVLNSGIALGGDLNIIRSNLNGVFLSYYLNNAKKKEIARLAQGISVVHLYSSQLQRLNINIPGLPEQQKIANCLSSIDDLISAQTQKVASLKIHKKGMMQQLFPAMDDDCMDAGGRATQDAKAEVDK